MREENTKLSWSEIKMSVMAMKKVRNVNIIFASMGGEFNVKRFSTSKDSK